MSWAAIVNSQSQRETTKLLVKYIEIDCNDDNEKDNDCIPRHREITPHPADDFIMNNKYHIPIPKQYNPNHQYTDYWPSDWPDYHEWIDYTKDVYLNAFKQSLPFSIQQIIQFANKLYLKQKVINLDFNKFEKDLKYQYKKYKGDKKKLKSLYLNSMDKRFYILLMRKTPIHFLFVQLSNNNTSIKHKILKMIKLLIINDIIDIKDVIYVNYSINPDGTVWQRIKQLLYGWNDEYEEYSKYIMNDLIDLIVFCINKEEYDKQEAIIKVFKKTMEYVEKDSIYCHNITEPLPIDRGHSYRGGRVQRAICNKYQVIERLLFRAVIPFQFVDVDKQCLDETTAKEFIENVLEEIQNVFEDTKSASKIKKVLSPLILLPHLNRVKNKMNDILIECMINNGYIESDNLSKQISHIISYHLFIDYDKFYNKHIQNNLNVKSLVFLEKFRHFQINEDVFKDYDESSDFLQFLVKNYRQFLIKRKSDIGFRYNLIKTYNDKCNDKFPLHPHGIYDIIYSIIHSVLPRNNEDKKDDEQFIELLRYIKNTYKEEFDINFLNIKNKTIIQHLLQTFRDYPKKREGLMMIIDFILTEFKGEYNWNNPCILYECMTYFKYFPVFKYLVTNYKEIYSLQKICEIINKMRYHFINIRSNKYWKRNRLKMMMKPIEEFCLSSKCENDKDRILISKSVRECWKEND